MPTYEYKCIKCEKVFDHFQSMTDKPLSKCKFCKGKVTRMIGGGAGIIFKGSGFYITDYKNSSSSRSKEKDTSGNSEKKNGKSSDKSSKKVKETNND